jgi:hypothetical protein
MKFGIPFIAMLVPFLTTLDPASNFFTVVFRQVASRRNRYASHAR